MGMVKTSKMYYRFQSFRLRCQTTQEGDETSDFCVPMQ